MQRAVLVFTKQEATYIRELVAAQSGQQLLAQKFSTTLEETAGYELSAADVDWLLDQLPVPQNSTDLELIIRKKLSAFLTQT